MTEHDRNLGFCEEANTYCSIAEKEYKKIKEEVIAELYPYPPEGRLATIMTKQGAVMITRTGDLPLSFRKGREKAFKEFRDFLFSEQDKYADDTLQLSMVNNIVDDFKDYWEAKEK